MASLGSGIPSCFTRCWRWPYSGGQVIFPPTGCPAETWRPFASDGPFGFAEVPPDVATTTPTIATMRTNTPAAPIDIIRCRRLPASAAARSLASRSSRALLFCSTRLAMRERG